MKASTCLFHPGIRTDTKPCYKCGPKEAPMSSIKTDVAEMLTERGIPFERDVNPLAAVPEDESTITLDADSPYDPDSVALGVADITDAIERAARDTWQPTLSDTLFPPVRRADTPMVKLSISGTIELTQEKYQAYLDGARLGPGAVVEVRAVGYVVQPGAAWTKRRQKTEDGGAPLEWWEREGRLKIKLVDIGELSATGEEWSE